MPPVHALRLVMLALPLAGCAAVPATSDDLKLPDGAVVATLVHPVHDPSRHADTCKPFHRVFADDGRQLTKDLGGLFPHHRGLFVGWNQVRSGGKSYDFWHCNHGEWQQLLDCRGGGDAPQELRLEWRAPDGTPVVLERRRLAVRALPAGAFVCELTTELRAAAADVRLGGDPQHAGCQFRALQQFAEATQPKVTYVRPASAKGGADDVWTDCRWIAARLPFAAGEVVVLRVEHPDNPPAAWSTRPYGRFGAMCSATLTATTPLRLRFAYVIAPVRRSGASDDAATTSYEQLAATAFAE